MNTTIKPGSSREDRHARTQQRAVKFVPKTRKGSRGNKRRNAIRQSREG